MHTGKLWLNLEATESGVQGQPGLYSEPVSPTTITKNNYKQKSSRMFPQGKMVTARKWGINKEIQSHDTQKTEWNSEEPR